MEGQVTVKLTGIGGKLDQAMKRKSKLLPYQVAEIIIVSLAIMREGQEEWIGVFSWNRGGVRIYKP